MNLKIRLPSIYFCSVYLHRIPYRDHAGEHCADTAVLTFRKTDGLNCAVPIGRAIYAVNKIYFRENGGVESAHVSLGLNGEFIERLFMLFQERNHVHRRAATKRGNEQFFW